MEQTAAPCQLGVMKENAAETAARMEGWRNEEVKREQRGLNYLKKKKKKDMLSTHPLRISSNTVRKRQREGNKNTSDQAIYSFIHSAEFDHCCH